MLASTSVLLYHEPMSAILVRVAYRLVQIDYARRPGAYATPHVGMGELSRQLQRSGFPGLSLWVAAYAYHQGPKCSTAAYKQRVIRRARWAAMNRQFGKPWARVPAR